MKLFDGATDKLSKIASILSGIAVVGYVTFMVASQYRYQTALQQTALQRLTYDSEKLATALSYFLAERRDDLTNLAESRELAAYYENIALGMSLEYGLRASSMNVTALFDRTRARKSLAGKPIYKRIVFIDASGRLLNDSGGLLPRQKTLTSWRGFLTPKTAKPTLFVDRSSDQSRMVVSAPCFFKGRYVGQVLGWISSAQVYQYFIRSETGPARHPLALAFGNDFFYLSPKVKSLIPAGTTTIPAGIKPGIPFRLPDPGGRSSVASEYAVLVPVANTPLSLMKFLPESEQLDFSAPRRLLYTTGGMALLVFAGMLFFQRMHMRNALLNSSLRETTLREQAVDEKNRQLAAEVAERKRTERELWENRELLRAVIEGTSDAVFVKDLEGRYLLFNAASARLTGKTEDEVLGRDDTTLFPLQEARRIRERDRSIIAGKAARTYEEALTDAEGNLRTFLVTKGPLNDVDGKPAALFGISRDITDVKRAEEALVKSNEELELRVRERTAEYEEINRELESFCYSVSHDMRAPIRHIDGFTRIFLEEYGDLIPEGGRAYLDRICRATKRMGSLIDDLLNLSRIPRGTVTMEPIDLSALAQEICSTMATAAADREVAWTVERGIRIAGDSRLIRIVMENLLDNAWKYTKNTEHALVEVGTATVDGKHACFVRDNGAGFDMAYAGKLFGVFQRLHKDNEYEGTGVGLAIVKRILQRHGCDIWAEGHVGEGAVFFFTAPQEPVVVPGEVGTCSGVRE